MSLFRNRQYLYGFCITILDTVLLFGDFIHYIPVTLTFLSVQNKF